MKTEGMYHIALPLDERNLAHVFAALTLADLVTSNSPLDAEARCWWSDDQFNLRSPISDRDLLAKAEALARSIRWVPALGVDKGKTNSKAHHGFLSANPNRQGNAFVSLADGGGESSPFKTFSGQQDPQTDIPKQVELIVSKTDLASWLGQRTLGVSSWGFDCRVGSHAYDLGFSSNDEGTGKLDPSYPAVELLALVGASCIVPAQLLQSAESVIQFTIWTEPILTELAPWAVTGRIELGSSRRYHTSDRGAAYGKGAAYRYFPSASLES